MQQGKWHNLRPPEKQRGGSFTINGWLGLLLLALCAAQGYAINRLLDQNQHLKLQLMYHQMMTADKPTGDADVYTTHCFPQDENDCVCGSVGFICYTRI